MSKQGKPKIRAKVIGFAILSILVFSFALVFATDYPEALEEFIGGEISNIDADPQDLDEFGSAEISNIDADPQDGEGFIGGITSTSGWNVTGVPICTYAEHGTVNNGYSVTIASYWYSNDDNLDGYIISHNASGSFVNSTWTSFDSPFNNTWANSSIPLDNDLGDTIQAIFYANATSGKWNLEQYSTTFTVTATITFIKSVGSTILKDGGNIANGTEIEYSAPDTLNMTAVVSEGYFFDYWSWYGGTQTETDPMFDFVVDWTTTLYLYANPEEPSTPDTPIIPPYGDEYTTLFFYYHNYAFEINNVTGYAMTVNPPNDATSQEISTAGSANVSWGARVWLLYSDREFELTGGTPAEIATLIGENASLYEGTFEVSEKAFTFGRVALEIKLYSRWDGGTWTVRTVFVSDYLYYTRIMDSNATLDLYIERTESGGLTNSTIRWGDDSYVSGIGGLIFKNPRGYDWQKYYMDNGNVLSFLTSPYVVYLGNGFYALGLFGLGMTVYIRYRQFSIIALLIVLLSGVGGVINLVVGEVFIGAVWLIAAFGIALVYWRVFR